jgi:hypothetical protein
MVVVKLKNICNFMRQACFIFKKKNNMTPAIDLTKKKKMTYGKHKRNMGTLTKLKSHQLKKKKHKTE